jgi:hypothetical protein
MFVNYVLEIVVFLVIRESDAQHLANGRNVMDQCPSTQLDIVRVRAEE